MLTEELFDGLSITCELVRMGKDYTLTIYGGERAQVLNAVGHKDEAVARQFAEEIAKAKNCTVACSCGIHIDGATPAQLLQIQESCMRLLNAASSLKSIPPSGCRRCFDFLAPFAKGR